MDKIAVVPYRIQIVKDLGAMGFNLSQQDFCETYLSRHTHLSRPCALQHLVIAVGKKRRSHRH